ncbi:hypothetical protein D1AOALGA4SA_8923 [Olavius algarvensis Delta 1 endosymbiont]|nr:hypothetical protein D1AOALGA4SA_8923 [Olavius algarvensis Delta 1 endosymbiont]
MFARDLFHSQIESFRKVDRFELKRQSEAIQPIFNFQYSIFNSNMPGF